MNCAATVYGSAHSCAREATRIVKGEGLCWQHAEIAQRPWKHWELEERELKQLDALAPKYPAPHWTVRIRQWLFDLFRIDVWLRSCQVCGRRASTSTLVVNPRSLRRHYVALCSRRSCSAQIGEWQGQADLRRQRSMADYEHEHGVTDAIDLQRGMPPQYPSLSRATLRAFLDSQLPVATVAGSDIRALNGSIRRLGFDREVYAEQRSGQAVLRRVAP